MTEKHVKFCFGIHNHQPVGNFGWVLEGATDKSYLPFLDVLADFPTIRVSIHTSGPLLDWIEKNRPAFIDKLARLVERGQVEILGGGYYEPILSMIPQNDALEQLALMNDWVKTRLGTCVRGIWLTERIWEPGLPLLFHQAGVDFTICDTTHFQWAGLSASRIKGYFVTDKHGKTVSIFPIDRRLRYTIPFHDPEETRDMLLTMAEQEPGRIITYADDGEKFGVWPGTYNLVYERRWLRRFFELLCEHQDRIRFTHFSEVIDHEPPEGRVMLPTASYLEMTQWALPARAGYDLENLTRELKERNDWDRFEPFLRGGFWDNFLVKYPEINRIHKRMIHISEKVASIEDPAAKKQAQKALFQGQCNCAYWHGLFGGLYLNYLRDALTRNLLEAEEIADRANIGPNLLATEICDFESRKAEDILISNDHFNIVVSPVQGGALSIVDLRRHHHGITNVVARRPEAYHEAVRKLPDQQSGDGNVVSIHDIVAAKENGLADYLVYDPWDRLCFQDHFLPFDVDLPRFKAIDRLPENDFIRSPFSFPPARVNRDTASVTCVRTGFVFCEGERRPLTVEKTYSLWRNRPSLKVDYTFTAGDRPISIHWACESNLTLLTKDAPDRLLKVGGQERMLDVTETFAEGSTFSLTDGWQGFTLTIRKDRPGPLWVFPIETVNQSEGGYERTYQGSSFTQITKLDLEPGKSTSIQIVWDLKGKETA